MIALRTLLIGDIGTRDCGCEIVTVPYNVINDEYAVLVRRACDGHIDSQGQRINLPGDTLVHSGLEVSDGM